MFNRFTLLALCILVAGTTQAAVVPSASRLVDTAPPSTPEARAWALLALGDTSYASVQELVSASEDLGEPVAQRAIDAALCAQDMGMTVDTLIVVDMSVPASGKRLWAFDMTTPTPRLVLNERVAHGAGSDRNGDGTPEKFSNTPDSHMTSLGLYRVAERYRGKNGWSRRLDGLFARFNGRARDRAVVMHPSNYVTARHVGRSQGCPAVSQETMDALERAGLSNAVLWIDGPDVAVHQEVANCAESRKAVLVAQAQRERQERAPQELLTRLNDAPWVRTILRTLFDPSHPHPLPLITVRPSDPAPGDPQSVCMPALMRPQRIALCAAPLDSLGLGFTVSS